MTYPDLRSLEDVDALPWPEFLLRVRCMNERLGWVESSAPETPVKRALDRQGLITLLAAKMNPKET